MKFKAILLALLLSATASYAGLISVSGGRGVPSPGGGASDFATRCAASGVLKCVSFDTDADLNQGAGGTQGAWGDRYGVFPPFGTSDYTKATRDTTTFKDGGGSLKFTIPATAAADSSGAWFTNFTDDLSTQIGEGQDIYIQWRQRFSSGLLSTTYLQSDGTTPANGWKLADISAGDKPTCSLGTANSTICPTTCWDFETVLQDTGQHNVPQSYANCAGSWPYTPMDGNTSNVTVQNVVECLYPTYNDPPCVKFHANEWMTFKMHIHVGTWSTWSSTVQVWVGREGQSSVMVIDCSPTATNKCSNFVDSSANNGWYLYNSDSSYKFGKIWFTPYHTNRSASFTYSTESVWYDDLIISTQDIADPSS